MASYEKLIQRIINNPKDRPVRELERIFRREGFRREKRKGGSHLFYTNGEITISIVVHDKKVKRYYVEKVIELLNLREKYCEQS
jgi:predicted RNA binding protein YcfA (HicA-like mRNA interferase family)